ncbi:MAG: DUF1778 domain-containing protein [Acidobacteria bacterium]|nr:DUF1778 domain-containing protein [Acidobacteriota bacterium]
MRKDHERKLSARDRDLLLALIHHPPEPNAALRKAVARYKKLTER